MLGFDVRTARVFWTATVMAVLFYAVYLAASPIVVCIFAIFFSYLIYPAVEMIECVRPKRVPRAVSIGVVFVLVILVLVVLGAVFGTRIEAEAISLSQRLPSQVNAQNVADKIPLPHFMEPMRERLMEFVRSQIASGTDQAVPLARKFGAGLVQAASNLIYVVLIPVLSFLMMVEAPTIRRELLSWMGNSNKRLWGNIIHDLDVLLSKYVRALLLLALATLVVYSIAFWVLDVPYGLLLAGLSALLEFVPFAGPLGAIVVTFVVTVFSGQENLLALALFFGAYRLFQDYVISPYLMSEGVEVSPLLVIIGLLVGDKLGGVIGIFLSVPVMAALKIIAVRIMTARQMRMAHETQDRSAREQGAGAVIGTATVHIDAQSSASPLHQQVEIEKRLDTERDLQTQQEPGAPDGQARIIDAPGTSAKTSGL